MVTAASKHRSYEQLQEQALHRLLTFEDLALLPDDGNRYEIIGGKLIVSPSPNTRHQRVAFELTGALYAFLKGTGFGYGFSAPMDVRLSPSDVVQPDRFVVLRQHQEIIQESAIVGAPDLVIEILSPSSIENDFLRKSRLYERSGVREYWIVNPDGETVSVQTLEGDRYVLAGEYSRGDTLCSAVLEGFELDVSAIFPELIDASAQPVAKESQAANDE
ncbi:MAG: Uma2 family endonuclease [Thermomicrobiales bacterium]|nr:Uma2 family endonuclease [Thermomicrobiales bacterium]